MRIFLLTCLLVSVLLSTVLADEFRLAPGEVGLAGRLTVSVPQEVTVLQKSPSDDVVMCTFKYKGKAFMKAYIGDRPSFEVKRLRRKVLEETTINGLPATNIMWQNNKGGHSRQTLIRLGDNNWPRYIHLIYRNQPPDMADRADQIINSVKK